MDFVRQSHIHLLPVFAWTMEDEDSVDTSLQLGVDGLITNDVEICLEKILADVVEIRYESYVYATGVKLEIAAIVAVAAAIGGTIAGLLVMFVIKQKTSKNGFVPIPE